MGLEKLRAIDGPALVLPNHPGYCDPPLVLSHVRLRGAVRPLVFSRYYRAAVLYPIMRLINALEVPDLREQSRGARQRTLNMIDSVVEGLQKGESFLIYPSGRMQRQGYEVVGAARSVSEILQRCPHAKVVLVRIRGLWGSMLGCAQTGRHPDPWKCVRRAVGWIAASLFFFAPRREVTMTVEVMDHSELPGVDRETLNRFLESWYNREGPETPVYVPYHRLFGPRDLDYPEPLAGADVDLDKIRRATQDAVNEIVEEHLGRALCNEEKLPKTSLDQIGLDSLARMDVALEIEHRFGFRSDQVAVTMAELWALAEGLAAGSSVTETPVGDRS